MRAHISKEGLLLLDFYQVVKANRSDTTANAYSRIHTRMIVVQALLDDLESAPYGAPSEASVRPECCAAFFGLSTGALLPAVRALTSFLRFI